jgi:hypothetical protein
MTIAVHKAAPALQYVSCDAKKELDHEDTFSRSRRLDLLSLAAPVNAFDAKSFFEQQERPSGN